MAIRYRYMGVHGIILPHGVGVKQYNGGDIIETNVPIEDLGFSPHQFELIGAAGVKKSIDEQIMQIDSKAASLKKLIENKRAEYEKYLQDARQDASYLETEKNRLEVEKKKIDEPPNEVESPKPVVKDVKVSDTKSKGGK